MLFENHNYNWLFQKQKKILSDHSLMAIIVLQRVDVMIPLFFDS